MVDGVEARMARCVCLCLGDIFELVRLRRSAWRCRISVLGDESAWVHVRGL